MTFKEQVVVKILLMIARHFCADEVLQKEIQNLQTHITVYGKAA